MLARPFNKRQAPGHAQWHPQNKEIQRCLKRYIAREIYPLLLADLHDASLPS